jgi:hypothetical protein
MDVLTQQLAAHPVWAMVSGALVVVCGVAAAWYRSATAVGPFGAPAPLRGDASKPLQVFTTKHEWGMKVSPSAFCAKLDTFVGLAQLPVKRRSGTEEWSQGCMLHASMA